MDSRVNQFLLELGKLTRTVSAEKFKHSIFIELQNLIRFDSGLWIEGRVDIGMSEHSRMLFNQPDAMMENYTRYGAEDYLRSAATNDAGITINHDDLLTRTQFYELELYKNHFKKYCMEHALSTAVTDVKTGGFSFLSFYRSTNGDGFSEQSRTIKQLLMPHVISAYKTAVFITAKTASSNNFNETQPLAIVDRYGVTYQQTEGWVEAMQKLVKRWRGPQLPVAIITCLKPGIHRLGVINLRVKQLENELLLCEALEPRNRRELSKRQREIAKLYAKGLTRIEISNKLGITQNTVVSHLDKIFERLEINNKAQLAGLMLGK